MRRIHVKIPLVFGAVLIFVAVLSISASASSLHTAVTSPGAVPGDVLINEFIATPTGSEAVEICNTTGAEIDIGGWTIDASTINDGVVVPANGYVVLDDNNTSGISISNDGDVLELVDDGAVTINQVGYGDDGGAPKPEYSFSTARMPDCATTDDDTADWNIDESPTIATANDGPAANLGGTTVTINEVDPNTGSGTAFIELYNSGGSEVDLSSWRLSSSDSYDIPAGQSIPAGGFWVLDEANFPQFFDLDASGDNVYLFNAALERVDQVGWDAAPGSSWNRLPDGAGSYDSYQQAQTPLTAQEPTKGASNVPGTPALIINEIDADMAGTETTEFIELYDGGFGNTALDGLVVVLFNGSDIQSYEPVFDLDGYTTDANGYLLIGGADIVGADITVTNSSWLQNGPDAVALYEGDAIDFPLDTPVTTTNLIDAIVYDTNDDDVPGLLVLLNPGQPQVNEDGAGNKDNDSNQRCLNGEGGARNTDTYTQDTPSPGVENPCPPPPIENCGDPFTPIYDIQGSGDASPIVGALVSTEGVVTGDFQAGDELNGFFVQDENGDGDTSTSDGVFIYVPGSIDVSTDDLVRVHGMVKENYGETQLSSVDFLSVCRPAAPVAPVALDLPVTAQSDFEPFEGMLVTFPEDLSVTEHYNQGRYGEVWVSSDGQLFNPTHVANPGAPAQAVGASNDLRRLLIDDGSTVSDPPVVSYIGANDTLRLGDTVTGLTGTLGYGFSNYRLQPTIPPVFERTNPRHAAPSDVGGTLKVASFNVLNYFTTIADGENDARGANSASEFTRQRDKIINAIVKIDADVVGLMEIENNGYGADSAIQDLVDGLNAVAGAGTYDLLDPGVPKIGTDAIAVGFLYKPASVTPVGGAAILDSSVDPQFDDTKNRPALAQTFMEKASGNLFTPVVNHLKSKGSSCGDGDDDTTTDGQGNCNLTRTNAATALANWLATDPTGSGDPDFLIIGDLNSYAKEDPIVALNNAGYTDLANSFEGMYAYSYVYSGEVGYLDYAMANTSILTQVTGTTIWDINSDEPRVLDYNDDILDPGESYINPGAYLYGPHAYRASDHDPVIVGLMFVQKELEGSITQTPSADPLVYGDTVAVDVKLDNATSDDIADGSAIVWLDDEVTYVDGSAYNATPLSAMQAADLLARMGQEAPDAVDDSHGGDEVVGILWNGMLASGETTDFGFVGMVSSTTGSVMHAVNVFDGYMPIGTFVSDSLDITETAMVELPLLADTWVNSDDSSSALNYNDYAALVARTTGVDNILLTFDRSALPEGANIISAELMVNVTLESGAFGKELTVLNTEGFDSATVTFETAPAVYNPGEPVAAAVGMLSFDVMNNVAAWDAAGAQATDDHHMDRLAISASGPFGRISMDSMESYQAKAPTLTVVYFVE